MPTYQEEAAEVRRFIFPYVILGTIIMSTGMVGCLYGCPKYRVWEQGLVGQAELARANQSRQIAVAEAEAKLASASKLAEAEIARAHGVAEANKIIGQSLHDNEAYLRYLWIQGIEGSRSETIYIPTEAGLPILEANRFNKPTTQEK